MFLGAVGSWYWQGKKSSTPSFTLFLYSYSEVSFPTLKKRGSLITTFATLILIRKFNPLVSVCVIAHGNTLSGIRPGVLNVNAPQSGCRIKTAVASKPRNRLHF